MKRYVSCNPNIKPDPTLRGWAAVRHVFVLWWYMDHPDNVFWPALLFIWGVMMLFIDGWRGLGVFTSLLCLPHLPCIVRRFLHWFLHGYGSPADDRWL